MTEDNKKVGGCPRWVNEIFTQFEAGYGNQWSNSIRGPEQLLAKQRLWFAALKKYPRDIILKAARDCIIDNPVYVPTVGAVVELTRKRFTDYQSMTTAPKKKEQITCTPEVAEENLLKLKELVGGSFTKKGVK